MEIFDLKDNKIVIRTDVLNIPEFKAIWKRDKNRNKERAFKELGYIYYLLDFNSPYSKYPESLRKKKLIESYMEKGWKEDKLIQTAKALFVELQTTRSTKLLNSALYASDKLSDYFDNIDFTLTDETGRFLYTAKDVAKNLGDIGKIVESLTKLEEQVKKEQTTNNTKIKGGGSTGLYEN